MKWFVALLLIVNEGVFLWVNGQHGRHSEARLLTRPDINPKGMLLLSEVYPSRLRAAVDGLGVAATTQGAGSPVGSEPQANAAPADKRQRLCYRVGPFKQQATSQVDHQWMQSQRIEFESFTSESREFKAVRIYLGPFSSKSAAQAVARRLQADELEHFTYSADDGQARISLGYFTQEALANKFVERLKARGFDAQAESEYRVLGPYNWLQGSIDSSRQSLLLEKQWSENAAVTTQVACQSESA